MKAKYVMAMYVKKLAEKHWALDPVQYDTLNHILIQIEEDEEYDKTFPGRN